MEKKPPHHHLTWFHIELKERSIGDLVADIISDFVGSWTFILLHIAWFSIWILLPVEPFPFGLLTMVVSLEAILLSTFIMMSQNRTADRDRAQAQADYDTNQKAEQEIEELQISIARIENEKLDRILAHLEKQASS